MTKKQALYRYISFESLVSIVQKQALTLTLPEVWEDPTEKVIFDNMINACDDVHARSLIEIYKWKTFCQCWTTISESDAMWRIYSYNNCSVRIKTYWDDLESISPNIILKKVEYVNNIKPNIPRYDCNNGEWGKEVGQIMLKSLTQKRKAFSHEKEVRLIYPCEIRDKPSTDLIDYEIAYWKYMNDPELVKMLMEHGLHSIDVNNWDEVLSLLNIGENRKKSIDVAFPDGTQIIRGVLVNPFADDWFVETVRTYCKLNGLNFEGKSNLYELEQ